jgi:putative ABC transport system permease protein
MLRWKFVRTSTSSAVQARRFSRLPRSLEAAGIRAATINRLPLSGYFTMSSLRMPPDLRGTKMVGLRLVSPSYFDLVKVRLVQGRVLTPADEGREIVVVNDVLARQLFGGTEAAIGQRIVLGSMWAPESEIVGVIQGVRHRGVLEEIDPELYVLYENSRRLMAAASPMGFLLASSSGGGRTEEAIRRIIAAELPEAEIIDVRPFEDFLWKTTGDKPLLAMGAGLFALIAVLLMLAGFHGMIGQALAERSREMAIRRAMGASPKRMIIESMSASLGVYVAGIGVGLLFAFALRNTLRSAIFVPSELPEPSLAAVGAWAAVAVGLAVVIACYQPVMRAIRSDPAVQLRAE